MRKWVPLLVALVLVAAACGGDESAPTTTSPPATTLAPTTTSPPATTRAPTTTGGAAGLADVCPQRIVLQTNWFPEAEHAGTYQLIGTDGTLDAEAGAYSGEIGDTGVELEIRAGGPFIGFQNVTSLLYQDPDIYTGYLDSGEAVELSGEFPTVAVMVNLEISPLMVMFDPATYDFNDISDIGESGATFLYFEGSPSTDYFLAQGWLTEDQVDASYDGSATRFVASGGEITQQGFVTQEVYKYGNEIEGWMKPVDYILMHDVGWVQYQGPLAVKAGDLEEKAACLEQLIPIMQQGWVDYMNDPGPINEKLVEIVSDLQTFWVLSPELNANATEQMAELGIVSNGGDDTFGNFDMERLNDFITTIKPLLEARGAEMKADLSAEDIATNRFIDPTIGL